METNDRQKDEALLVDLLLGRCDAARAADLHARIARDEGLRRLHDDLRNTFAAMDLAPEHDPPEHLVGETMRRIRSARQTDALLAREELSRSDVIRPTFSLRELGAIAGVVLLVISIFGVSFREAGRRRDRTQCAAQVARLGSALLTYANKNDGRLPSIGLPRRRWLPSAGLPAVSNSKALFKLLRGGYVEPTTFQCPAVGGGSFVVHSRMIDFPNAGFVTYSYQHAIGGKGIWLEDRRLARVKRSLAILADCTPLFPNGRFAAERVGGAVSDNHDGSGQNVLYLDMHVAFRRLADVGVKGDNIYLAGDIRDYQGEEAPTGPHDTFLLPAFSNDGITESPPDQPDESAPPE